MKFFHRTYNKNATSILKHGFHDSTGKYLMPVPITGVWISDKIFDENEVACADVVLLIEVRISKKNLDFCEVKEEDKPYREWCFLAQLLNKGKIESFTNGG